MEKQAIYRYLGGAASEPQLDEMIARAEAEIKRAAAPRYVDGRFPLSVAAEGVTIGGTYLASKTLASHLRGCQEAFLTAFTLGPGIDALIKRYELMEMPLGPRTAGLFGRLHRGTGGTWPKGGLPSTPERGLYLRPRYSPGYGDCPLPAALPFDACKSPRRLASR